RLANHFGWPMNNLTSALYERNGPPVTYWRIGTQIGDTNIWDQMRDGGFIAIGWNELGDLSALDADDRKESIQKKFEQHYPGDARVTSRKAGEIRNFAFVIEEGTIVVAADGERVLGVGRVAGPYQFASSGAASAVAPHRHPVDWISTDEWKLPVTEGLRTTVCNLKKFDENALAI